MGEERDRSEAGEREIESGRGGGRRDGKERRER